MPKLRCSALSCMHNQGECCCRGEINVAGYHAYTCEDTACSNFYEGNGSFKNATNQEPMDEIKIACAAENCVHNCDCRCYADYVDVNGYGARDMEDTACASFRVE